jgi:outer membrane receptor for ferrienterochelin and colicins
VPDYITLYIGVLPFSYFLRQPAGMSQTHFADNRVTSLMLPPRFVTTPFSEIFARLCGEGIVMANFAEYASTNRSLPIGGASWDPLRVKAATGACRIMNQYQNSFSVIRFLIVGPIVSLLSFTQTSLKPRSSGRRRSHPAGIRLVQQALILVSLCLLPLLASTRALAQKKDETPSLLDMSLEDLMAVEVDSVYGASGFKQKVTEAPASITIITSEEIQRYGYRTLADILRNVRGFYVSSDRNYSYLGVRGYGLPGDYNSRITLLVDGHRLNDNIFDAALIGTEFPIDVDLIDRVEVIRGPNSSLYIASAFLGVIDIITKRGRDLQKVSVAGSAASYGSYQGRVSYGNEFKNGLELLLSGSFYDSHGQDQLFFPQFNSPATNNGIAVNADDDESRQLLANVSWGHFTLHGVFGSRDKGIPTAPFGTVFNVTGTHTIDARGYLDLQYDRKLSSGWSLTNRLYYDQYNNDGTYIYDYSASGGPSRVMNRNFAHGKWWGDEVALSKQIFGRQRLTFGSEFRDNFQQDQGNYDVQPFVQYFTSYRTSNIFSVYAQDEIHLRKNLVLNLGLRYDHYSTFGGTTNPRAALIYSPWERSTFKLLYGQSFRAPNFFELYYAAPGNESNPSLRPETAKTMELVWEQYFANHFRMTVSGFYYPIHGLIGEQIDLLTGNAVFTNAGSLDLRGVDFELGRKLAGGLEGTISYSFQQVASPNTPIPITNSPKHLVQASLSVPLFNQHVFASMDLQYVSSRATLTGQYTAGYVVPNFTLFTRKFLKGWELSASLYNAFNQKYADPAGGGLAENVIVQDGRGFRIKVGYKFQ